MEEGRGTVPDPDKQEVRRVERRALLDAETAAA